MLNQIFNSIYKIIKKLRFKVFEDLNINTNLTEEEISEELNSK
jgi:hypothetical protein